MKMRHRLGIRGVCAGTGVLLLAGLLGGCKAVSVGIDPTLADASTEVHLVGINASEYEQWHDMSMDDYWKPTCELREQAVRQGYAHVIRFGSGHPSKVTVGEYDYRALYGKWQARNARDLFILASLTGKFPRGVGNIDGRRKIHPLGPWPAGEVLKCVIGQGGIVIQNPAAEPRKP